MKGFLFEIDLAIHFFRLGYEVQFADLLGQAQYDLLVSNDEHELEVECKRKSIDAGRKIKKGDFYLLADILFAVLKTSERRFAILIKSSGRLGADQGFFKTVATTVAELLKSGGKDAKIGNLEVIIEPLPSDLEIRAHSEATKTIAPFHSSSAYYAVFSNQHTTFIIKCESANKIEVLDAIYDELKKGASQLSGRRPSLLACLIEELEDEDWEILRTGSGLAAVATRLFSNPSRRHINLLAFSSDRTPPKAEQNILSFSATNLKFWHRDPKFPIPHTFFFPALQDGEAEPWQPP